MLVKHYFQQQKKQWLSSADKFLLYEKISLWQKNSQHWLARRFSLKNRLFKIWTFSIILTLLWFWLFQWMSNDYKNTKSIISFWKWINEYNNNFSHASAIWQIVKAQWHFTITKAWQLVISDKFSDWDILSLDKFSTMTFDINQLIQAKIVGPAKFTVHKVSFPGKTPSYRIHMLEWDFISVKSKNNLIASQKIEITTPDWVIVQEMTEKKWEKIDFSMVKKNKKAIVYNKWTNKVKIVKSNITNKNKKKSELSVINQKDMKESESIDELKKEITQLVDNLKKTYSWDTLTWFVEVTNIFGNNLNTVVSSNNTSDISNITKTWKNIKNNSVKVSVIENNTKLKKQIENLNQLVYKSFIKSDVENIFKYYLLWQKQAFNISVWNLSQRLKQIYQIIWNQEDFKDSNNINDLYNVTNELLNIIKTKDKEFAYSKASKNIIALKNWLFIIKNSYSFGQLSQEFTGDLQNNKNISFDKLMEIIKFEKKKYLNFN